MLKNSVAKHASASSRSQETTYQRRELGVRS